MKLTIAFVTMNRSNQLKEAVNSCMNCNLPKDTQFVVIDNSSTDDTETVVKNIFCNSKYELQYEKMIENIGAGDGRNVAFGYAKGDYVYFMDDDAYIESEKETDFFQDAIKILDKYQSVVTLTTQIYDLAWKADRMSVKGPAIAYNLYRCFMVCGGSHFLRKSFFCGTSPYFSIKYGNEEMQPSLRGYDKKMDSVYCPSLRVIHNPLIDKWNYTNNGNTGTLMKEVVNKYVIKSMVYPRFFQVLLFPAFMVRRLIYLSNCSCKSIHESKASVKLCLQNTVRIKSSTVFRLFKYFGISIF